MRLPTEEFSQLRDRYVGRRVCVTGGTGFIGGHLIDALLSLGAIITVIDDLSNSALDHLSELIDMEPERVRFVHGSILEPAALADAIEPGKCEYVFHLAAIGSVPRSIAEPTRTWDVNATGTLRVLRAAQQAGVRRVHLASSSSVYGDQRTLPMPESAPTRPLSPYAMSKLAGEQLCAVWSRCYGLSTVCTRYFNIFGPRQAPNSQYAAVVAAFCDRLLKGLPPIIYGDGKQSRDFTFVDNAVLATLLAASSPRAFSGECFNVGCGKQTSVLELAHMIAVATGNASIDPVFERARSGEVPHSLADISAARELLNYEVLHTVETGLTETLRWHRQHQDTPS